MVTCQRQGAETLITLEPNRSATRRQTLLFLLLVSGVTLSVALFWTFFGAWMVLPFAGLEIAVLTYVALRVSRSTYRMQVIRVGAEAVEVEEGEFYPVRKWRFPRPDTHVNVLAAATPMDAIGLQLQDGRQSLEVGSFLNQGDRLKARDALQASGLMLCNERWWHSR
ncbi:DUF2244 domain-containing protein [Ketobacter sp.]|uniref:DUF2244 domain-containing protein n=1 Tax=Ketobacter sp. TaxID=2083498 RepID=UPI0025B8D3B9|nr:DUF2244 domain-containing protein [Ketobacter sp.]